MLLYIRYDPEQTLAFTVYKYFIRVSLIISTIQKIHPLHLDRTFGFTNKMHITQNVIVHQVPSSNGTYVHPKIRLTVHDCIYTALDLLLIYTIRTWTSMSLLTNITRPISFPVCTPTLLGTIILYYLLQLMTLLLHQHIRKALLT